MIFSNASARTLSTIAVAIVWIAAATDPAWAGGSSGSQPLQREIHIGINEEAREDLVAFGGHIRVDGTARRNILVIGGKLELNGTTAGDVVAVGADVSLGATAVIQGDMICIGPRPQRAEGSKVLGEFVYINTPSELSERMRHELTSLSPFHYNWTPLIVGFKLVALFTWFLISAVVVLAFPGQVKSTAAEIPQHFARFGLIGFLWFLSLVVTTIILALLCAILIGIPLLLLFIVFVILIKVFGNVSIYYAVGIRVLNALGWRGQSDVLAVLAGLALLGLVQFLPVIGWIIWTVLGLVGMGATLATKFGTGQPWLQRRARAAGVTPS